MSFRESSRVTPNERTVSAAEFYTRQAASYRESFEAPHRKAYDLLAWRAVSRSLPHDSLVVDIGCGVGRWVEMLLDDGHRVIGIEPSPGMAATAALLERDNVFSLQPVGVDDADVPPGSVDSVVAMGSLQYTNDPAASIAKAARWLKPGGSMWVLVDGLYGLVAELLRNGDFGQAAERARTRRARFVSEGLGVEHHLLDSWALRRAFEAAGMVDVEARGLLISWNAKERQVAQRELVDDWQSQIALEETLSGVADLADFGKQLLAFGRLPASDL